MIDGYQWDIVHFADAATEEVIKVIEGCQEQKKKKAAMKRGALNEGRRLQPMFPSTVGQSLVVFETR